MNDIQFDFNPLTPVTKTVNRFPWGKILIGVGLLAIVIAVVYNLTKSESVELPDIQQDYDPETNDQ